RARVLGAPWWLPFYRKEDEAGALELTAGIALAFSREVTASGAHALVVILPSRDDLEFARREGRSTYAPLVAALEAQGTPALDLGGGLLARLGSRPTAEIFARRGHYDEEGNRIVAELMARYLLETCEGCRRRIAIARGSEDRS
ncbi:MAG: hypothetical protein R3190_06795, partial [Thermoanaerobaculia bacterium]|nr:hypothetical protein [Thermoanaerobaculia bacterium]